MNSAVYRIITWLLLPAWLAHTVWRSLRDGKTAFLLQRIGIYKNPQRHRIWVHAASVGEVNTVIPLLVKLRDLHPHSSFLLTTTTPTGKQVAETGAKKAGISNLVHAYLPIDYSFPVSRFLKQMKPSCALVVETEIWPCLYAHCEKQSVPLAIINGRLSEKTRRITTGLAAKTIAPALTSALASADLILARSEADANGFTQLLEFAEAHNHLNAKPDIYCAGNLKHLQLTQASSVTNATDIATQFQGRTTCLLASTHDNEEDQLVREWLKLQRRELLIVVPRHPERGGKIETGIRNLGAQCCRRTVEKTPPDTTQIYIADTLGELEQFYGSAAVTFVGGSLVAVGGHNILEAAQAGCAIVVGPQMYNFEEELRLLQQANAIMQAETAHDVVAKLAQLLDDDKERMAQAQRAKVLLQSRSEVAEAEILDNYLQRLRTFLAA